MKPLLNTLMLMIALSYNPQIASASETVPHTVKRIKPLGAGFIELIGPGKIRIDNKEQAFEHIKYVKKSNVDTLTSTAGTEKGCVLAYATERYSENIIVEHQSCNEILSVLSVVR